MEKHLTLSELADLAQRAVEAVAVAPKSNQAKSRPAPRMLRYYQSIGLLSPPAAVRGRTPLFGRRHLEEVLAVKRLQADGVSLEDVRSRLEGLDASGLSALARFPEELVPEGLASGDPEESPDEPAEAPTPASRTRSAFWSSAPPSAPAPPAPPLRSGGVTSRSTALPAASPVTSSVVTGVRLVPGADLVLHSSRPLTLEESAELSAAAAPLLSALTRLGLLAGTTDRPSTTSTSEETS